MPTHDGDDLSAQPGRRTAPPTADDQGRRRAEVFGDVLPDQTSDERDLEHAPGDGRDDELRREVPPHHG
jgi:hypothetical protein